MRDWIIGLGGRVREYVARHVRLDDLAVRFAIEVLESTALVFAISGAHNQAAATDLAAKLLRLATCDSATRVYYRMHVTVSNARQRISEWAKR